MSKTELMDEISYNGHEFEFESGEDIKDVVQGLQHLLPGILNACYKKQSNDDGTTKYIFNPEK